jgi:hypothetical protein
MRCINPWGRCHRWPGRCCPQSSPSKGRGKVVRVVCSDDKVSLDDDVPLQRQMRACGQDRSMSGGPPLAAPELRLASSAATKGATEDAAKKKKAVEEAVKKKATEEAVVRKR